MRKDWIRKRQRKAQQISGIMRLANQTNVTSLIQNVVSASDSADSSSAASTQFRRNQHQETNPVAQCCATSSYNHTTEHDPFDKRVNYVSYYASNYNDNNFGQAQYHQTQPTMVSLHESTDTQQLVHGSQPMSQSSMTTYVSDFPQYPNQVTGEYMLTNFGGMVKTLR